MLIKDGIPEKVVSERLGHGHIAFTMQTYQHVLPGMQADAARSTERLAKPAPPPQDGTGEHRGNRRRKSAQPGGTTSTTTKAQVADLGLRHHTFPGMQADAARAFEALLTPPVTENPALPEAG